MTRSLIGLGLGALLLLPPPASAQDQAPEPDVQVFVVSGRPRIGVMVDMNAGAANDKLGATVQSVTPDGPAAKAGLQAGDIITTFNGTALGGDAPGKKLVELAQGLSVGDTVKVQYRRGKDTRSASIVAAELGGRNMAWRTGPDQGQMIDLQRAMEDRKLAYIDMDRAMQGLNRQFRVQLDRVGFGLELADMNAGLGQYFGTSTGVLVLDNPADSTMPLKAGDVILAIDGRAPADVGQARRILSSYDSGDVAKFEIMRMKKKTSVSWTVPARHRMKMPGGMMWQDGPAVGPHASPGSAPRVRVRVAPPAVRAAPAAPALAPAPPAPPSVSS
jgi:C-terminal processing protease CtpA/Prc